MHQILDHLENKRHVIWDWNGTLLDDVDMAVAAIGEVLQANGLSPIERDAYRQTFCFPISEYYRRLGFGAEGEGFEKATRHFVSSYAKRVPSCRLHEGTSEVLKAIRELSLKQSILSAAHESDLNQLLAHFGIQSYFDHVFGLSDHYAASKVERGRQLLDACGVSAAESILIGDTDHDFEVGRELGVDVLLLGDGHQHEDRLRPLTTRFIPAR
jgi:phosphoglycolate phosphatase